MDHKKIKSRERVATYGEVFTSEKEVAAMLDLVESQTKRIEATFLEPSCGDGAFLSEILKRKLGIVKNIYQKSKYDYERYSILALSTLYGVELLPDNVQNCRERLFSIWDSEYLKLAGNSFDEDCRKTASFILKKNILLGDALTLRTPDGRPIIFAEWSLISGTKFKRRDYDLHELIESSSNQLDLFDQDLEFDPEARTFIPIPIREYPITDLKELYLND